MPQTSTPKRKQVRLACTSCRKSKTGCDEQRPCRRCVARGKADTCSDAPKKRRTVTKKMKSTNKTKDCTTINNKKDILSIHLIFIYNHLYLKLNQLKTFYLNLLNVMNVNLTL